MGFPINEEIETSLDVDEKAIIILSLGDYRKNYIETTNKEILDRAESLILELSGNTEQSLVKLHYKDIATITVAVGDFQMNYINKGIDKKILKSKRLVDRLGNEMYTVDQK